MVSDVRGHKLCCRSFWTLTGSPSLLSHPLITSFAAAKQCSPAQAVYRLAQLQGVTPLSGTTNEAHMRDDIALENIEVGEADKQRFGEVVAWMGLS